MQNAHNRTTGTSDESAAEAAALAALLALPPQAPDLSLAYGASPAQRLDCFLPQKTGKKAPLLLCFHGGYWRTRYDNQHLSHACRALAEHGYVAVNVEYRRLHDARDRAHAAHAGTLRDMLADVQAALSQARAAALRLDADAECTLLLGHSAGGHLALWLAARCARKVRAAVALAPLADLQRARALRLSEDAVAMWLTDLPRDAHDAALRDACALQAMAQQRMPPRWLLHGARDAEVPIELSQRYVARACALRQRATLPCGHYAPIMPNSAAFVEVLAALSEAEHCAHFSR